MTTGTSITHRLQKHFSQLAERVFGANADETARGEFTSAFISEQSLADYRAREDQRRHAFRPPVR